MKNLPKYIRLRNKTHLIFDFDGTLADLILDWSKWHLEVLEIIGKYDKEAVNFRGVVHYSRNDFLKRFGRVLKKDLDTHNEKYEAKMLSGYKANDYLVDFVKNNSEKYYQFLYTSNSRKTILPIVEELEIIDDFKKIITADEVEYFKPHPFGFDLIYDPNIDKLHYLMIGDSKADSGVAKAAGIDYVDVTEIESR